MDTDVNLFFSFFLRIEKGNAAPDSQKAEYDETKYRKWILVCSVRRGRDSRQILVDDDVIPLPSLCRSAVETKTVGSVGRSGREAQRYQNGLKDQASLTSAICMHAREKARLKPLTTCKENKLEETQVPKVDVMSTPKFKAPLSFEL